MNRQTFTAYHTVTDRPMLVDQQIVFDGDNRSGVYKRVYEKEAIVKDIYMHPDIYDMAALEYHTAVVMRELAMEEVRAEKYPFFPSRLACLYVSDCLDDAIKWGELFAQWGRPTYHIVKLAIEGNVFVGNANNCFYPTGDRLSNLLLADRYWSNVADPTREPPIKEMLVDGNIEVVEIVKEINANIPYRKGAK